MAVLKVSGVGTIDLIPMTVLLSQRRREEPMFIFTPWPLLKHVVNHETCIKESDIRRKAFSVVSVQAGPYKSTVSCWIDRVGNRNALPARE